MWGMCRNAYLFVHSSLKAPEAGTLTTTIAFYVSSIPQSFAAVDLMATLFVK